MVSNNPPRKLQPRHEEELRSCISGVGPLVSAQLLWDRVLTPEQRQRLGGDLVQLYQRYGTVGTWRKLYGGSRVRAALDIARELGLLTDQKHSWLLREWGESPRDAEAAREAAIASGALVLVERPRAAYWNRQQMDINWERLGALWTFFWKLARHAQSSEPLDYTALGESAHRDIIAKLKCRLTHQKCFPRALGKLIQPTGPRTQELKLRPDQIHIFEWQSVMALVEVKP